ncbi:hypothetical protein EDB89DRAFT_2066865 [Lactarius sanguifluus]|nr:hypothetical protein EDB89DRAFT_2066865 [Lactarius sanguifluus]
MRSPVPEHPHQILRRSNHPSAQASGLRDNVDIVHQLLEETINAGGHPLTTSPRPNVLRDIVLPPFLINKILFVTGSDPMARAGFCYNHNDIYYFGIVEMLGVNKPFFSIKHSPSFTPVTDGRFTHIEHLFGSSASIHSAAPALTAAAAAQLHVQVPFPLRASLSITDHGGLFFLPARNSHLTTNIPATSPFELSFALRADALSLLVAFLDLRFLLGHTASHPRSCASTGTDYGMTASLWLIFPPTRRVSSALI